MDAERSKLDFTKESIKLQFDLVKHLTTLSTGSMLLLVTLLEKVLPHHEPKWLIVATFAAFLVSVAASLESMSLLSFLMAAQNPPIDVTLPELTGKGSFPSVEKLHPFQGVLHPFQDAKGGFRGLQPKCREMNSIREIPMFSAHLASPEKTPVAL